MIQEIHSAMPAKRETWTSRFVLEILKRRNYSSISRNLRNYE
jgi:hypothetical protein